MSGRLKTNLIILARMFFLDISVELWLTNGIMFAEAPEKPLLTLGKRIEVMRIDKTSRKLDVKFHFPCNSQFELDLLREKSNETVKCTMEYLFAEGFIQTLDGWNVCVNLFGHPTE
jgi:hypothetical protein